MNSAYKRTPVQFGKYLLLDRINIGGMAEVWRAKTKGPAGDDQLVAVKRILPNISEDDEFIEMFIDEAKITVQLTHTNICAITELGCLSNTYFIAMEYIAGKDLRAVFEQGKKSTTRLPVDLVCYVMAKVCEGLDYAHHKVDPFGAKMNIVHRDVSPQNVLISFDGDVKVIDFGIAKAAGRASRTQAGILKGKFGYMSPEQVNGEEIDHRADVFAAGVCLYELLTGERLFVGETDYQVLEKVRSGEVRRPSNVNPLVPPELDAVVLKALERKQDTRYANAGDIAEALMRHLVSLPKMFTKQNLADFMRKEFAEDVEQEKQRLLEYAQLVSNPPVATPEMTGPMEPLSADPGATAMMPSPLAPPVPAPRVPSLPDAAKVGGRRPSAGVSPVTIPLPGPPPQTLGEWEVKTQMLPSQNPAAAGSPDATQVGDGDVGPTRINPAQKSVPVDRDTDPQHQALKAPISAPVPTDLAAQVRATGELSLPDRPTAPSQSGNRLVPAYWQSVAIGALAACAVLLVTLVAVVQKRNTPSEGLLYLEVPAGLEGKVRVSIDGKELKEPDGTLLRTWPQLISVPKGTVRVKMTADGYAELSEIVEVRGGREYTRLSKSLGAKAP